MKDRMFVDIHVIETLPPSCVNRDDLGSPKTAYYGGVTRARVSSQAWKRAIRNEFNEMSEEIGMRTKKIYKLLVEEIHRKKPDIEKYEEYAACGLKSFGVSVDKDGETNVLIFAGRSQISALADKIIELGIVKNPDKDKKYKKACEKAFNATPSMDVALFGRMLAADADLNCDAAAQVAHAISTHEVHNEFDYFTAVDDCKDSQGAAHLDTTEFNSSTMYRYATVNALELEKNLADQTPHVIRAFVEAFIRSMPTGKQNSFANRVRPDAVYVTVRRDQPVNMAAAFEKPVQAGKTGYVEPSIHSLVRYAEETYADYYDKPELSLVVGPNMEQLGDKKTLTSMLDALEAHLTQALAGKEQK